MTDQCMHCTVRGDIDACMKTPCSQHESWYAQTLKALAKQEQGEPVAWAMFHDNGHFIDAIHPDEHARIEGEYTHPLYTQSPQQRTWVWLSEEQKRQLNESLNLQGRYPIIDAIEAKCKGNNT